jgi:LPS-assembly protein
MPRRDWSIASSLRLRLAGTLGGVLLISANAGAAPPAVPPTPPVPRASPSGGLLPPGFFDAVPFTGSAATVEADMLTYDAANDTISAEGGVVMTYEGATIRAERLVYNRKTGALRAPGEVSIVSENGTSFVTHDLEVTGGFKEAFMRSLTLRTADGSLVTADSADYSSELKVVLENGFYSHCCDCIDAKGRRIGWNVRGARIVYDRKDATVTVDQPYIEVLGIPFLWLPWMQVPDPTQPRANGFRLPDFNFTTGMGLTVQLPYFWAIDPDTDLLLIPRAMSRQGGLLAADLTHRFGNGSVNVKAAGVYQLDPSAFAPGIGDGRWRGAIQTSGAFTPIPHWTAGWSYTAFSDAAFLPDYALTTGVNSVNEVYVTHLSPDYYANLRFQQFNLLGNYTPAQQDQQAKAVPNFTGASTTDLPDGWGQVRTLARVLGVDRGSDQIITLNGVPYALGYKETKVHASLEASWQDQWVAPGGLVVTPYLGARADAAFYDGGSAAPTAPAGAVSLLSATPIAAHDVRWPLIADDRFGSTYLLEPIAQVVYRGSTVAAPGITDDDALSFVFDDTNLFSYNRFSGSDRQETGLRANLGGHFAANFADGSWLDLLGGQSYFLAGVNSLGIADAAQVGANTGLGGTASYVVLGAKAGLSSTFSAGGKVQVDPAAPRVTLAGLGARYADPETRWSAGLDYTYIAADPMRGTNEQQEITGTVGMPIDDYWTATATASWDIASNTWLEAGAGILYDDGYTDFGFGAVMTGPTHSTPNDFRATASFHLKSPVGKFGIAR